MINLYQQRDFGEKINATFAYAVSQFRSLGMALLYIAGPITLLTGIVGGVYQSNMLKVLGGFGPGSTTASNPFSLYQQILSPAYGLLILFALLSYIVVNLTVYSHLRLYARNQGAPISVSDVWQELQTLVLGGIGITFSVGLSVVAVMLLLLVMGFYITFWLSVPLSFAAGVYVSVPLSLAMSVFVFEGWLGISGLFNRCFRLIQDKWWSTFGLLVVMLIITYIVAMIFTVPATIVAFMGMTGKGVSSPVVILTQAISMVGTQLLSVLVPLGLSFQYFNLVERKEGTGLLSAIDSIGSVPPPLPQVQDEGQY